MLRTFLANGAYAGSNYSDPGDQQPFCLAKILLNAAISVEVTKKRFIYEHADGLLANLSPIATVYLIENV